MDEFYELSKNYFHDLNEWYKVNEGNRNEATTRAHLINEIVECLGYTKDDVTMEDAHNGEYADYTFRNETIATMILEAKREGVYFELPILPQQKLIRKLSTLCKDNKAIADAINQVMGYCQNRGVEVGVVSNGWQIVAFIASRSDGVPPIDGKAYVFDSLQDIENNFLEFWNILSKTAIEKGTITRKLTQGNETYDLPKKLAVQITDYPGIKNRNEFQTDMQIISEIVLEDVIKNRDIEKEFLSECYCQSGALSKYALLSKALLNDRYTYIESENSNLKISPVRERRSLSSNLNELISNSISKRPILLIGNVGVGKTTFINHLIHVEAADIFNMALTFKIDLGEQVVIAQDLKKSIVDKIYEQFLENYGEDLEEENLVKGIYHKELMRFEKGIYRPLFVKNNEKAQEKKIEFLEEKLKNRSEHLKNAFYHITKGRSKQIIIFIDNCDQRNYTDQQESFLIAQELASNWPVTVFLSLRPETFHRSIKEGALSGYHPRAFTISPPKIEEVIEKRLNFAQKIAIGEIQLKGISAFTSSDNLNELIEIMKYSFENNKELLSFIENISGGNVRRAIDLVKNFFGSGHIDTKKMLELNDQNVMSDGKMYLIPLHEFVRAVIYGDNVYYDPRASIIANLFDVRSFDEKEHFLAILLLAYLYKSTNIISTYSFIKVTDVIKYLQTNGFTVVQIHRIIENLKKDKLIESDKDEGGVRITTSGLYHLNFLIGMFTYIDAIVVDTPIFNKIIEDKIENSTHISDRLVRAQKFDKYLDTIWEKYFTENKLFDWKLYSEKIKLEIEKIQKVFIT